MNLIRILIVIAVVWLLYQVVKGYLGGKQPATVSNAGSKRMVRCAYCDLHIPEDEALQHDGKYYCSREHLELNLSA